MRARARARATSELSDTAMAITRKEKTREGKEKKGPPVFCDARCALRVVINNK